MPTTKKKKVQPACPHCGRQPARFISEIPDERGHVQDICFDCWKDEYDDLLSTIGDAALLYEVAEQYGVLDEVKERLRTYREAKFGRRSA